MEKQKNSRQIPDKMMYTANKDYDDLLYGYLQEKSFRDVEGKRFVDKKDVCFATIAKQMNRSRQTIAKYFKNLVDMGFVIDYDKNYYQLIVLDASISTLVPFDTLRIINNTLHPRCVSIYVYLFNRFYANNDQPFLVTLSQLKAFVGLSTSTRSNDDVVNDILFILRKIGLIEYTLVQTDVEKTNIKIIKVTNKIA